MSWHRTSRAGRAFLPYWKRLPKDLNRALNPGRLPYRMHLEPKPLFGWPPRAFERSFAAWLREMPMRASRIRFQAAARELKPCAGGDLLDQGYDGRVVP